MINSWLYAFGYAQWLCFIQQMSSMRKHGCFSGLIRWWICESAWRNISQRPATGTSHAEENHRPGDPGSASKRDLQNDPGAKTIIQSMRVQISQWIDPLSAIRCSYLNCKYCSTLNSSTGVEWVRQ